MIKKFLSLDTSILEIWGSVAIMLLAVYSIIDPLPQNMLDFQLSILWIFEMLVFGVIGVWTVFYKPKTFLRTWVTFLGSLFWFYYAISVVGDQQALSVIVSSLMSLSLAVAFLQRSAKWPDS